MDVYTDGACSNNPGPGGWAWVTTNGRHDSGGDEQTTNQRMELTAVLKAVETLADDGDLHVYSDSTYVVNCFRDRWFEGWKARNWHNSQKKPVANRDLWEPLIEAYLAHEDSIEFTWVKGHAGNELNELADRFAVAQVELIKERMAEAASGARGAGTSAGGAAGSGAGERRVQEAPLPSVRGEIGGGEVPWPAERAVVVTGGRDFGPEVVEALSDSIAELDPDYDIVVSGLRLGAELVGAETALNVGVPLAVVLPYPDPVKVWGDRDRARFDQAVAGAEWVVTLEGDRVRPSAAIAERNAWMWRSAVGAIVVNDEKLSHQAEAAGLGVIDLG